MYRLYIGLLLEFTYLVSVVVEVVVEAVPFVVEVVGVRNIPSRENDCRPLFVVLKNLRLYSAVPLVMSDSSDMACTICDKVALCTCVGKAGIKFGVREVRAGGGGGLQK
jgi:hypothetical protein